MTATIIPNAIHTVHVDAQQRREEYLRAIDHYRQFAEIYFLENSTYDLSADEAFYKYDNVHIRKFPASTAHDQGKGYQEFAMLDMWLNTEPSLPPRWIKITGRHLASNFDKVFAECMAEDAYDLIIEQKRAPSRVALTDLFYTTTAYYRQRFLGIYQESDDSSNVFIEHVVRNHIQSSDKFRLFREMPLLTGIRGTSGEVFGITLKKQVKRLIGKWLYAMDDQYRFI